MASATTVAGRRWTLEADPGTWSDEVLLECFLAARGESAETAFRVLVGRHGPMVLGVCRQIVGRADDAEDAFQATFLVLARHAESIRDRRVLARWLYEVAYRIAVRSKAGSARRRTRELEAAEMAALGQRPEPDPAWDELRPVLHEEVNKLPASYRAAVVLCYFEGRTNEEAAALLRWPVGTVKGRLARARELLRHRLTRRGLVLSAAFLVSCVSQNMVFAEVVPARLVRATGRAATALIRGETGCAAISPEVLDLVDDALASGLDLSPPTLSGPVALGLAGAALVLVLLLLASRSRGQEVPNRPPPVARPFVSGSVRSCAGPGAGSAYHLAH